MRAALLSLLALVLLACAGIPGLSGSDPTPAPVVEAPPAAPLPPEAPPPAAPAAEPPAEPPEEGPPVTDAANPYEPAREVLVKLFAADCRAPVLIPDEMEGGTAPRCESVEFDQMCAPDPSGCWDEKERCVPTCNAPCSTCEERCAEACETCKGAGEGVDLQACAEARASCSDACFQGRGACIEGCLTSYRACDEAYDQKRKEMCPSCEKIATCIVEGRSDGDCAAERFKEDAPDCWTMCDMYAG